MNEEYPPMCYFCAHAANGEGWKCSAFPDGVPSKILKGRSDHRKPVEGDHGVQFSMSPEANLTLFGMLFPAK